MRHDYTANSHYLTHTFLFRKVGRMYFLNLGVRGLNLGGEKSDRLRLSQTTNKSLGLE